MISNYAGLRDFFGYSLLCYPILKSSTKIFYLLCCLLFTSGISSSLFSFQGAVLRSRLKPDTSIQPLEHLYLSSIGGDNRIRTDDPLLAKQVLSQLSYTPEIEVVGPSGLEPPTSRLSVVRSSQLSYGPASSQASHPSLPRRRESSLATLFLLPKSNPLR